MARYIDADALLKCIPIEEYNSRFAVMNAPTADVRENKHGEWIKDTKRFGEDNYHCSVCSAVLEEDDVKWRNNYFCYHCGAAMRKVGDSE